MEWKNGKPKEVGLFWVKTKAGILMLRIMKGFGGQLHYKQIEPPVKETNWKFLGNFENINAHYEVVAPKVDDEGMSEEAD